MRRISSISAIWWIVLYSVGGTLSHGQTAQPVEIKHGKAPSNIVEFDANRWYLSGEADETEFKGRKAEIVSFDGRKALTGTAYLKDVGFLNGTIEVDLWITGETNFAGFMFRVQSFEEYEWCWLRTFKTNGIATDAIQYAPAFKGAFCWQLNGGPGGIGPVNVPKDEWVHMKMEILNESAALYVKDMTKPVMIMDHLQHGLRKGSVGLQTLNKGGVYFSNFTYQIDEDSKPVLPKEKVIPPNAMAKWQLSPLYQIQGFDEISSTYPILRLTEITEWITPDVDESGLVNITKYHGRPGGIGAKPDCAILRSYIDARQEKRVKMNFGYSDAATIFLNQTPLFHGNSAYQSRSKAYAGWISFNDAVFLNLKTGRNELLVVVAEDFGGWGFQAKLDDVDGIDFRSNAEAE